MRRILPLLPALLLATGAAAQLAPNPPPGTEPERPRAGTEMPRGPIQDGRRQPIPRASVEDRQRAAGVAAPAEREQRQLQDLNAISRQLTPPGTPVPAPEIPARR